jgi:hypothetical protein
MQSWLPSENSELNCTWKGLKKRLMNYPRESYTDLLKLLISRKLRRKRSQMWWYCQGISKCIIRFNCCNLSCKWANKKIINSKNKRCIMRRRGKKSSHSFSESCLTFKRRNLWKVFEQTSTSKMWLPRLYLTPLIWGLHDHIHKRSILLRERKKN